jgi:hypothetical protein
MAHENEELTKMLSSTTRDLLEQLKKFKLVEKQFRDYKKIAEQEIKNKTDKLQEVENSISAFKSEYNDFNTKTR